MASISDSKAEGRWRMLALLCLAVVLSFCC